MRGFVTVTYVKTMKQELNILMIDDHPMVLEGYMATMNKVQGVETTHLDRACSLDEAVHKVKYQKSTPIDLIFLDICMPPSQDKKLLSGEDLGIYLRKKHPNIKILILTMLNDTFRLESIMKSIQPDGLMVKSKVTPEKLEEALRAIVQGKCYFGEMINGMVRKPLVEETAIDEFDRKILYFISLGEKMKDLPKKIPLSMPTIERRKRRLKCLFDVKEDRLLLKRAKEKGLI